MADTIETMGVDLRALHEQAENEIQQGQFQVGRGLKRIRESHSWRLDGYASWGDYCERRWSKSRRRADQLIAAAEVADTLGTNGSDGPENERQARELIPLKDDEERLVQTWRTLREEHGQTLTAEHVKHAVAQHLNEMPAPSPPEPPPPKHKPRWGYRVVATLYCEDGSVEQVVEDVEAALGAIEGVSYTGLRIDPVERKPHPDLS